MQDLNDKVTGNSLSAAEWNEVPSEIQNVIENTGQTLSGADLNQLGKGIAQYAINGDFYTDSGAANAYVLSTIGSKQEAAFYADGDKIAFFPTNANTGASTVNRGGLGAKNLKDENGNALVADDLAANSLFVARYNNSAGEFRRVPTLSAAIQKDLKSGRTNFFANGQMRISQEFGTTATTNSGTAVKYVLDQIYSKGVTASNVSHQQITGAGTDSNQTAIEIIDSGVNTGAVLAGFACELTESNNEKQMTFSFNAQISANDDIDYEVYYADDSAGTNSTAIASGTIAMTTGYKTYSELLAATVPAGTNLGVFVLLKKNSGASARTHTITGFQLETGSFATNITDTGEDGGLSACQRFYQEYLIHGNLPQMCRGNGSSLNSTQITLPVYMRVAPTGTFDTARTPTGVIVTGAGGNVGGAVNSFLSTGTYYIRINITIANTNGALYWLDYGGLSQTALLDSRL